jgi:DNA-binding NarL/FixJ family response regulator
MHIEDATTFPGDYNGRGKLSRRESQVLGLVALGLTNREIADRLEVTVYAIKFHLSSIYRKFGVANRTEAAVVHLRQQSGAS